MQFKLSKSYRYWWPVTVRAPDPENAGKIIEQKLRVQFEPKPRDQMLAAQEAAAKLTSLRELTEHEIAEAKAIVRNWEGVVDEEKSIVPFSAELLEQALQQPWFRKGINDALIESMNGEEARLGN
ncbi:MAG: hypothetical protein BGP11_08445 [Rhodobacterales bacterium 65-51]|uniref:hypothetical protein n=1 Tax=uncultured Gemmobacter sp. TaxID=1095917 RepID=UPI00095B28BA|nr:hypothetical protein [uncultured Gemmobacter sp.]OJY36363.1 MAG: hypothetical protein BGP11_08445 [Rhodobacterales bacterium 65-51]